MPALCRCTSSRADTSLKGKKAGAGEAEPDCTDEKSEEVGELGDPGLENDFNFNLGDEVDGWVAEEEEEDGT
jgi:hypothetical protein